MIIGMIGEELHLVKFQDQETGAFYLSGFLLWVHYNLLFARPIGDKPGDDTSSFEFSFGASF